MFTVKVNNQGEMDMVQLYAFSKGWGWTNCDRKDTMLSENFNGLVVYKYINFDTTSDDKLMSRSPSPKFAEKSIEYLADCLNKPEYMVVSIGCKRARIYPNCKIVVDDIVLGKKQVEKIFNIFYNKEEH